MPRYKKEFIRLLAGLSSVGMEMGFSVAIGIFFGYELDKYFKTGKTLTIIFTIFGIAAAFKSLYIATKRLEKDIKEHKLDDVFEEDNNKNKKE